MNADTIKPRYVDNNIGLTALAPCHASLFFDWINNPKVRAMRDFDAYPFGLQDAEKYVASHLKDKWLIVLKDDKQKRWTPIGYAGLSVRQRHRVGILGYAIGDETHEGRGFATKAVGLIIQWAFDDLDLVCIHASAVSSNDGSIAFCRSRDLFKSANIAKPDLNLVSAMTKCCLSSCGKRLQYENFF